jgi:hypothetical protein
VQEDALKGKDPSSAVCLPLRRDRGATEFLRGNNCDLAQGYFFRPPLPIPDPLLWLKKFSWIPRLTPAVATLK